MTSPGPFSSPPAADIAVSIIVPVKDNQAGINALVRALEAQTDQAFELIIVDDASDAPIIKPECKLDHIRILRLDVNVGQSEGRNIGARAAEAWLLAFVDSDCAPNPDWIANYRRLRAKGHLAIGSSFLRTPSGGTIALLRSDESTFYHSQKIEPVNCFTSSNFAIDAATFAKVGGFPRMRVGEDFLLGYGLFIRGIDVLWFPRNGVSQNNRERLLPYLRQQFAWAKAAFVFQMLIPLAATMKWNVRRGTLKPQIVLTGILLMSLALGLYDLTGFYLSAVLLLIIIGLNGPFLRHTITVRGSLTSLCYLSIIVLFRNSCWLAAIVRIFAMPRFWSAFTQSRRLTREVQSDPASRLRVAATSLDLVRGLDIISRY